MEWKRAENVGNDYFADLILADLLKEGYTGSELLSKFRERQNIMHAAVRNLSAESGEVARNFNGVDNTETLFGDVMGD